MDARAVRGVGDQGNRGSRLQCRVQRHRRHRRDVGRTHADGGLHSGWCGMNLDIPDFALVVLIGASGSGKSTFAAKHFVSTEVISSDYARGLVSDDETDQSVSADAFELVRAIAEKRL